MTDPVSLPFWLFAILCCFAAFGIVDRIFAPSVRWFLRRRLNRAIEEINNRLDLKIPPFKLTRRRSLIDRLLYDPRVVEAVETEARQSGEPRAAVMRTAERYAGEIVPSFSVTAYFGFGIRAARWLSEFVYRVRLGHANDAALDAIAPSATVIFVMNHRSNMDYVLVTYMASQRASLSYAVGEWARIFLLQSLVRSMGAYFIRRNSRNALYRRILGRFVNLATSEGVTQAVFLEGGLTRDGTLNPPRLGLLSYMVEGFDPDGKRDIVFVPVGINYDRVAEDRILTASAEKEITGRDFRVRPTAILAFLANLVRLRLAGRLYRYGYACVSFGEPVSLARWQKRQGVDFRDSGQEARFAAVEALGDSLMGEIAAIVPVTPVALVSRIVLENGDAWIARDSLRERLLGAIETLESAGAHVLVPRDDRDYALETGLRMLILRRLVERDVSGSVRAVGGERILLAYYANSIAHLFPADAAAGSG